MWIFKMEQCRYLTGSWSHPIGIKIDLNVWQNKTNSVFKVHAAAMNICWEILDETLFENLDLNNMHSFKRELTFDWYRNISYPYRMACLSKKCVNISSICNEPLPKNLWRKLVSKFKLKNKIRVLRGNWLLIGTIVYPNVWHALINSVLKFNASAMKLLRNLWRNFVWKLRLKKTKVVF